MEMALARDLIVRWIYSSSFIFTPTHPSLPPSLPPFRV